MELEQAINAELLNRSSSYRRALERLILAAGELNVATDGMEALRAQRENVLAAMSEAMSVLKAGG